MRGSVQLLGGEIHLSNKMILGLIITTPTECWYYYEHASPSGRLFWGVNTKQSDNWRPIGILFEEILSERWQSGCEYGHHVLATNAL